MTKNEFLKFVTQEWSQWWDREYALGEPDFCEESTIAGWLGSIDALSRVRAIPDESITVVVVDNAGKRQEMPLRDYLENQKR